jgi:hypothetical protein
MTDAMYRTGARSVTTLNELSGDYGVRTTRWFRSATPGMSTA